MDLLVTVVKHSTGSLASIIEALYLIGRYDLLEDSLNLTVNQDFQNVRCIPFLSIETSTVTFLVKLNCDIIKLKF